MDDESYFQAWFPLGELRDIVSVAKPLRKAALIYYRNMSRVHDSLLCAPCFTGVAARMAWAEAMATHDVEAKLALNIEPSSEDQVDAFWEARWHRHLMRQIQIDQESEEGAMRRFYGQARQMMLKAMRRYPDFPFGRGLEAVLSSAVIHASAAMEVCFKQVFEAAATQSAITKRPTQPKMPRQDQLRIVFLWQTKKGQLPSDPVKLKTGFGSLGGCRMKYAELFFNNSTDLDEALASYELDPVVLVRNALVHTNGVKDDMYKEQAKGIPMLAASLAVPDHAKIPIDGAFVEEALTSSLRAVKRVVISVDQWLLRNK